MFWPPSQNPCWNAVEQVARRRRLTGARPPGRSRTGRPGSGPASAAEAPRARRRPEPVPERRELEVGERQQELVGERDHAPRSDEAQDAREEPGRARGAGRGGRRRTLARTGPSGRDRDRQARRAAGAPRRRSSAPAPSPAARHSGADSDEHVLRPLRRPDEAGRRARSRATARRRPLLAPQPPEPDERERRDQRGPAVTTNVPASWNGTEPISHTSGCHDGQPVSWTASLVA